MVPGDVLPREVDEMVPRVAVHDEDTAVGHLQPHGLELDVVCVSA